MAVRGHGGIGRGGQEISLGQPYRIDLKTQALRCDHRWPDQMWPTDAVPTRREKCSRNRPAWANHALTATRGAPGARLVLVWPD